MTPAICTAVGFCILTSLGIWQIQRLEWKNTILNTIDRQLEKDPSETNLSRPEILQSSNAEYPFLRGTISGRFFIPERVIFLGPRPDDGKIMFLPILPFQTVDGVMVYTALGKGRDDKTIEKAIQNADWTSIRTIKGYFKEDAFDNPFVPRNSFQKNRWYRADIQQMARFYGLEKSESAPLLFYVEQPVLEDKVLNPLKPEFDIRNDHFQYAMFWFSIAVILVIMFYLRFIREKTLES